MNEPKRRGRPPGDKHLEAMKAAVRSLTVPHINGDTSREPEDVLPAKAYAQRVWSGQSTDLPRNERLRRVERALQGQGMSMEGVTLP
jgi:hypothetical protein